MRDVNVALIAITPFETTPRLQRIFNQWAATKLLTFIASCSPRKMLRFDIFQLALRHFVPKLFTVDYLKCVLLNSSAGIRVRAQYRKRYTILVKNIDCNDQATQWTCWMLPQLECNTKLALIVKLKWYACKKLTSSLKSVVILSAVSLHWNCAKNI